MIAPPTAASGRVGSLLFVSGPEEIGRNHGGMLRYGPVRVKE